MTIREYKANKIYWNDYINPSSQDIDKVFLKYKFHELDKEAILEVNQRARVDTYDDYLFIVLNFPKFNTKTKTYTTNELNVFLSKDYILTFRYFTSSSINKLFDKYTQGDLENIEINTGYILYDLIDAMLDKLLRVMDKFSRDLRVLESEIFSSAGRDLIYEIMIKKRNAITLKHMLNPQIQVLKSLELRTNELFKDEYEVYFENLIDKLEKVDSEILVLQENIESMEDTLKSIYDMKTNSSVKYLTIFSAFMLPLTFITGFYGMNLKGLPFDDAHVYYSLGGITILMFLTLFYLLKNNKL